MRIHELLIQAQNQQIQDSITGISEELARHPVLVAARGATPQDMEFEVARDKQNLLWIYVFTGKDEFSAMYPQGGQFVEMPFVEALKTVGPDNRFGGIFINAKSPSMYPIPAPFFGQVAKALKLI